MLDFICPKCGYLGFDNNAVCASCGSRADAVTDDLNSRTFRINTASTEAPRDRIKTPPFEPAPCRTDDVNTLP